MTQNPDQPILDEARKLANAKRYAEARDLLQKIQHNPTAQKWLKKLDEVDPPRAAPPSAAPPYMPTQALSPDEISPMYKTQPPMPAARSAAVPPPPTPRATPPMPAFTGEVTWARVGEAVQQRQYDQARALLAQMPASNLVQHWSEKLDQVPLGSSAHLVSAAPLPQPPTEGLPPLQRVDHLPGGAVVQSGPLLSDQARRWVVSGAAIVGALLMIIGFFAFPWIRTDNRSAYAAMRDYARDSEAFQDADFAPTFNYNAEEDDESEHFSASAFTLWRGGNLMKANDADPAYTIRFDNDFDRNKKGFGAVRLVDLPLILLPLLALGLLVGGILGLITIGHDSRFMISILIAGLALVLFPLAWQAASTVYWQNELRQEAEKNDYENQEERDSVNAWNDIQIIYAKSLYHTTIQQLLGLGVMFIAGIGLADAVFSQRQTAHQSTARASFVLPDLISAGMGLPALLLFLTFACLGLVALTGLLARV